MYLETTYYDWYCVGEGEHNKARSALRTENIISLRRELSFAILPSFQLFSGIRYALVREEKILGYGIRNQKQS